jgi:hypothetical protein
MKMPKGKKKIPRRRRAAPEPSAESVRLAPEERIMASDLTLHQLFQQQTAVMLDRADLSEEQKQSILIGMSCPCCGAGGFSYTAKLKSTT